MKIDLTQNCAYLLRLTWAGGAETLLCDALTMLTTIDGHLRRREPRVQVQVLTNGLRWRIVPKKEMRALADAALQNATITLEENLNINFWFK